MFDKLLNSDAQEYETELQTFEDAIYSMEQELDLAQQEREDLEKINEELNRMVFDYQESDRKKQQIIHKYQEQNKANILSQTLSIPNNNSSGSNQSAEAQKLNRSVALQPKSYRQYSHSENKNNPFNDDDTDESDWDIDSEDDEESPNHNNSDTFELVATNRRQFKQSLAQLEKQLHLENGLEALALDNDEIEKLKSSHYNKQETLDKLKSIEKALDEKDRLEIQNSSKNKARRPSADVGALPATIQEEGADGNESSDWDDLDNNDEIIDLQMDPALLADAKKHQQPADIGLPPMKPTLENNNTIENIIQTIDLGGVGMEESEARKILEELMSLKQDINTPTLTSTGFTPLVGNNKNNSIQQASAVMTGSAGQIPRHLSLNQSSPSLNAMNALQQFQHTFQSSTNMLTAQETVNTDFDESEALKRAQEQVFAQETLKAQEKAVNGGLHKDETNNFSDIFPTYSMASKSEFSLKDTTGSLLNMGTDRKQQGDMLDSMVSNQIELKLQQTQLEAAMTKMELLDELKIEIDVWDPPQHKKRKSKDDFGMPRISTLINLDELADELQTKGFIK